MQTDIHSCWAGFLFLTLHSASLWLDELWRPLIDNEVKIIAIKKRSNGRWFAIASSGIVWNRPIA